MSCGALASAGEWIGTAAAFSANGQVQPLPERFVPPDFAQWDITVQDWATASSFSGDDGTLKVQTKYMLPTVGARRAASALRMIVLYLETFSVCSCHICTSTIRTSKAMPNLHLACDFSHCGSK